MLIIGKSKLKCIYNYYAKTNMNLNLNLARWGYQVTCHQTASCHDIQSGSYLQGRLSLDAHKRVVSAHHEKEAQHLKTETSNFTLNAIHSDLTILANKLM